MSSKGTCKLDGCDGAVRGKGYCGRHYQAWRRGKLPKAPYRSCNEKSCSKPTLRRGLCEEHFKTTYSKAAKRAAASGGGGETSGGGSEETVSETSA